MQVLRWTLAGCLIVCVGGCGKDAKSSGDREALETAIKEKILGTWELTKSNVDFYEVLRAHYKDDKNALQLIQGYKEFEDLTKKDLEIVQDAIGFVTPPPVASVTVEFLKDGKMKQMRRIGQKVHTIRKNTYYEIVGMTITMTSENGNRTGAAIEKLTDTELVISFWGGTCEYKKK